MKRQKRLWTAAAACAVLGAACRAVPGVRFAGLLFWCLTALLIVFAMLEQYKEHAWAKWGKRVLLALVCLGLVAFGYLESLVIRGAHTDGRAEDAQCVVILGAGVNGTTPSLMLSAQQARRQLTICEKEISAQETAIAEIEQRLEEAGGDYERYSEIYKEKEAAEQKLSELMEKWETLAEQAGE